MKTFLTTVILITVISFTVSAQTNVSGGIFANTTWTVANSPYIVVDTIVVFPGVTLTIEPGVVVKFDDYKYIEMRQATLIATGTATDSITFTSNNPAPAPGIWGHSYHGAIWFNGSALPAINFWNLSYAITGIESVQSQPYLKNSSFLYNIIAIKSITQTPVDNCVFKYNGTGIETINGNASGEVLNFCTISNNNMGVESVSNSIWNNCTIDSNSQAFGGITGHTGYSKFYYCSISNNNNGLIAFDNQGNNLLDHCVIDNNAALGVFFGKGGHDSIVDSEIKYNGTGVTIQTSITSSITHCDIEYDTIGINFKSSAANISCNKICNNISYGFQLGGSNNFNVADNYWCTTDSTQIAATIYDGYDNINYGLVTFLPLDSTCAPGIASSINEIAQLNKIHIFPNPASDYITIESPADISNAEIKIFNLLGEIAYSSKVTKQKTNIDISTFPKGAYIIQISDGIVISRQKLIRQ